MASNTEEAHPARKHVVNHLSSDSCLGKFYCVVLAQRLRPVKPQGRWSNARRSGACRAPAKVESCAPSPQGSFSMRFRRSLAPLALLLSATSFATPALAAPAMAASRYLTGSDLFNLEVATD